MERERNRNRNDNSAGVTAWGLDRSKGFFERECGFICEEYCRTVGEGEISRKERRDSNVLVACLGWDTS